MNGVLTNRGFSLVELVIVALLIGIVASVAIPRALHTSPERAAYRAARELAGDLEQARTRAVADKRALRVKFDAAGGFYTAFLDTTADYSGGFAESEEEVRASGLLVRGARGGTPGVVLPENVVFGSGAASIGPQGRPTGAVVLSGGGDRLEISNRGLTTPLGTSGVIYISHVGDPTAVAAVTISGAGSFQTWRLVGGKWVR